MDKRSDGTGREVAGILMLFIGLFGALAVLVVMLGALWTLALAGCAALCLVGHRLASGTPGETKSGTPGGTGEPEEVGEV